MKKLVTIILLNLAVTATFAQRGKKIKGNGNVVTIERQTGDYDALRVGGFYEVELVEGNEGKITLSGEDNILEFIETEVKGGTLTIKSQDNMQLKVSTGEKVFITIPVQSIDAIRLSGSGRLSSDMDLKADNFKVHTSGSRNAALSINANIIKVISSGSSNIKLDGKAEQVHITSSGSSNLRAHELTTGIAEITSSGSSNIHISVINKIDVRSSGSSNVKYRGNPEKVYSKASGSSKLSKERKTNI